MELRCLLLAIIVLLGLVVSPTMAGVDVQRCRPKYSRNKAECLSNLEYCSEYGYDLKWTGVGCVDKDGNRKSDGGCQCRNYCGYTCAKACRKDSACTWNKAEKACYFKSGGKGSPVENCFGQD